MPNSQESGKVSSRDSISFGKSNLSRVQLFVPYYILSFQYHRIRIIGLLSSQTLETIEGQIVEKDSEKERTEQADHGIDSRRCEWCGLPITYQGFSGKSEYCSADCAIAQYPSNWRLVIFLEIIFFPLLMFTYFYNVFFSLLLGLSVNLLIIVLYRMNQQTALAVRKERPKNSRRYKIVVLNKSQNTAMCHSCGGHINLKSLKPSNVFECDYCGAMGIIQIKNE